MSRWDELRRRVCEANLVLKEEGLVVSTFGNVSGIDRAAGIFAIKPSGVPYEELEPGAIVIVDLEGSVVDGDLRPSSDTRTHAVLYRSFESIGGIAHTHSPWATAWAQAEREIPLLGTTHADLMPVDVPCTRVMDEAAAGGDYERATGDLVVERFRDLSPAEVPMVLVARHGPFTWGTTAAEAVHNSLMLEEVARTAAITLGLAPDVGRLPAWLQRKHFERKHGEDAYYGQEGGT